MRGRNVATTLAAEELYMKSPSATAMAFAYVNFRLAAPPNQSPSASQPNTTLRICQLKPICPPTAVPLGSSQVAVDDAGRDRAPADRIGTRRNAVLARVVAEIAADIESRPAIRIDHDRRRRRVWRQVGGASRCRGDARHRDASQEQRFHRSLLPQTHMVNRPKI
jgi:hypothetical protein